MYKINPGKIESAKKNLKGRGNRPLTNYFDKIQILDDLLKIHRTVHNPATKEEIKKIYIVGLVTALEVYCKDMLRYLVTKKIITCDKLLNRDEKRVQTFSYESVKMIRDKKFDDIDLVIQAYNFLKIDDINKLFSRALSIDFFTELKKYVVKTSEGEIKVYNKIESYLEKIIDYRHDYVHDVNFKTKNPIKRCNVMKYTVSSFVIASFIFTEDSKK